MVSEQLAEKERITGYAAKLLKMLRVDGLLMTWNGGEVIQGWMSCFYARSASSKA